MSLDALIMLSGALVVFLSVAGFPPSFYKPMFFILGIFVAALGIIVRRQRGERETAERLSRQAGKHPQMSMHAAAPSAFHENEMGR